jgi:hypothetical protein
VSTKLYNGYRIHGAERTTELYAFVAELRSALEPAYTDLAGHLLAKTATTFADAYLRGEEMTLPIPHRPGQPVSTHPYFDALFVLDAQKRALDADSRRRPAWDLSASVAILCDPDDTTILYALFFCEQDVYREVFEGLGQVESFGYWNNTDRPGDLTQEEWAARAVTWERVLAHYASTPAQLGLTWELLGQTHDIGLTWDPSWLEPYLPDKAARARQIAERQILVEFDEARTTDDAPTPEGQARSVAPLMHRLMVEREEILRQIAFRAPELEATLVDLTAADLRDISALRVSAP